MPRPKCPNGMRKTKAGKCAPYPRPMSERKRCPNGTRKTKAGNCAPYPRPLSERKRCPNGTRKNKQGICVEKTLRRKPVPPTRKLPNIRLRQASLLLNGITRTNRISNVLKVACKDPTRCIALGQYREMINRLFDNFTQFHQVDSTALTRVGSPSGNGFVAKIPFEKDGYTAYAILKSSADESADNLMYEYLVGIKFVNAMCDRFPCFLETYSMNQYTHQGFHFVMKNIPDESHLTDPLFYPPPPLQEMLSHIPTKSLSWPMACDKSTSFSILLQYFDNVMSLYDLIRTLRNNQTDLLPILYQVYYVLDILKDVYTHYDLHTRNVLMYKPFPGNVYMTMHYHQPDGTIVTMHCDRIAKIIDYGRNYFKTDTESTETIANTVNRLPECTMSHSMKNVLHHTPRPNATADLLLANYLRHELWDHFNIRILQIADTRPQEVPSDPNSDTIHNVTDMRLQLEHPSFRHCFQPPKYKNWTCGGEMHIYPDGRPYTITLHSIPTPAVIPVTPPTPPKILELNPVALKWQLDQMQLHPHLVDAMTWASTMLMNFGVTDAYRCMLAGYIFLYIIQQNGAITPRDLKLVASISAMHIEPKINVPYIHQVCAGQYTIAEVETMVLYVSRMHMSFTQIKLLDDHIGFAYDPEPLQPADKRPLAIMLLNSILLPGSTPEQTPESSLDTLPGSDGRYSVSSMETVEESE